MPLIAICPVLSDKNDFIYRGKSSDTDPEANMNFNKQTARDIYAIGVVVFLIKCLYTYDSGKDGLRIFRTQPHRIPSHAKTEYEAQVED